MRARGVLFGAEVFEMMSKAAAFLRTSLVGVQTGVGTTHQQLLLNQSLHFPQARCSWETKASRRPEAMPAGSKAGNPPCRAELLPEQEGWALSSPV